MAHSSDRTSMGTLELHLARIEERIQKWVAELPISGLYGPIAYLVSMPAKRVRPAAVLMGCELFGGRSEDAMEEALGIELFHNFTLMHDDIMDAAPLRRGQPSVHTKWDINTAILSGDALMLKAHQVMSGDTEVSKLFDHYALEVCEGQQLDMEFEQRDDVSLADYTNMIRKKTAVLLSCALQVGAIKAGAPKEECERLGRVGEHLGLAFQLRDDLLDAFGDAAIVGKRTGGDLRSGKKTWLLIRGLELADARGDRLLHDELANAPEERNVERMTSKLDELGARGAVLEEIDRLERTALEELDAIPVPEERKVAIRGLAHMLMARVK